ncbi:DNA gyrase inhibitor YacG [Sphingomonas sp. XXL09]|uniref:DNA gyrase inhibitor YacG n=1 Tax=Sphingomonas sp. XXL09 TaxID=3457787 RepID=UPI00406BB81F
MTDTRCPICDAPTDPAHAPFCSRGCKDRDLLQWLGEGYRVPVRDEEVHDGLDSRGSRD